MFYIKVLSAYNRYNTQVNITLYLLRINIRIAMMGWGVSGFT